MRRLAALALVVFLFFACAPAGDDDDSVNGQSNTQGDQSSKDEPVPTATALMPPGDAGDGSIIMVNGRAIRPAGDLLNVRDLPSNLLVLPDGVVVTSSIRSAGFNTVDGDAFTGVASQGLSNAFYGLAVNAAGNRLYVSGGASQTIYEYDVAAGVPNLLRTFVTHGFPVGLALSADESQLFVCSSYGSSVQYFDLSTGLMTDAAPTGVYPYEVLASADGNKLFASNWGGSSVTVINAATAKRLAEVGVGQHPEGMALSPDGSRLFVANADSDQISVIDTAANTLLDTYDVYEADAVVGATPTDVAVSGDGATLYVSAAGLNAVVVLDAANGDMLGMIPVGYYPTSVALDESRGSLYVTNGKGGGIPTGGKAGVSMSGTVERVAIPDSTELAAYTQVAEDNLTRTKLFWETLEFESPIPTVPGTPSQQIKRVVFLMRENKTYDQELSDIAGTNGDPSLLIYGQALTPNTHALAQMFTNCDNYYSEANVSVQGHLWATMMYCTDYVEKMYATSGHEPLGGVEPASIGGKGSFFKMLMDRGINFRVYGQVVGTLSELPEITPYMDLKYGFYSLGVSDETKIEEVIREMEGGIWPQFVYISLPNDHTNGSDPGQPTPDYLVGDNDAATGKLIDYITHSEYWSETAIFLTEDDPQSGADHVDPHRTISLVISPWAKHGYVSSVLYSMSSIWLTMELILGVPPMSVYDENASPMFDCFTMTPDNSTYTGVPNPTPLAYNPDDAAMADYSHQQIWTVPDQVRRLGEVIWAMKFPGRAWPAHLSVDSYAEENLEAEDLDDVAEYHDYVRAAERYALTHGLWDGSRLPTIREQQTGR